MPEITIAGVLLDAWQVVALFGSYIVIGIAVLTAPTWISNILWLFNPARHDKGW